MLIRYSIFFIVSLSWFCGQAQNIVLNGGFEDGMVNWNAWIDATTGYTGSFQLSNTNVYNGLQSGEVVINTIGQDSAIHKINVKNTGFSLVAGMSYDVSCYVKCSVGGMPFVIQIFQDTSPYTSYSYQELRTSTDWTKYSFTFVSPVTTSDVRFV